MSDNYLIAVGGSGIKCLESLIHLAAIGTFRPDGPVNIAVVDADGSNGNLDRLKNVLQTYQSAKENLRTGTPWFSADFVVSQQGLVWSPVTGDNLQTSLSNEYSTVVGYEKLLFETLYSKEERDEKLDGGFRGHPAIGSLLFARNMKLKTTATFWYDFCGKGSQLGEKTNLTDGRIFVIGSIFGGTGASGVPVIIRKVYEEYKNQINAGHMHIGAAFLLPYFEFISPEDKGRLHAVSSDFAFNSQCALRYYEESQISNLLSEMYFVGNSTSTFVSTAAAGEEQKNPAMLPEVVAACGISKFFERGRQLVNEPSPYCSCREDEQNVNFNKLSEIPMLSSVDLVSFSQAAISLYTFLGEIKEMLRDKNKRDKTISWFPKYFPEADEFSDRDWEELKNKVTSMRGTCDVEVITDLANNTTNRKIEIKEYGYLATYLLWLFDAFSQVKDIHTEKLFTWIEDQGDNQAFSDLSRTAQDNSIRTLRQNLRDSSRCRDKKGFNDLSKRIYKHTTTASIRKNDKKSKKIAGEL